MKQSAERDKAVDTKERYEKRHNIELKSVEWFEDNYPKIYKLLQRGKFFRDSKLLIKKRSDNRIVLSLFTNSYSYSISIRKPDRNDNHRLSDDGYLGCICSLRKPYAGEDWTRGNDLSDGIYSEETWNKILSDILNNELEEVKLN